jgi:hypothetical protein
MPLKQDPSMDGYEALSDISDATIAAVRADMVRDPRDTLRLYKDLSSINSDVSLAVLAEARQALENKENSELAYIQGATFVIRMLVKQGKAYKLHNLLFPDASPVPQKSASGNPPATDPIVDYDADADQPLGSAPLAGL